VCGGGGAEKPIFSSLKNFTLSKITSSIIFVSTRGHQNCEDIPHIKFHIENNATLSIENKVFRVQQMAKQQLTLLDMW
jgi:hypothetical protein